jgi:23S rRNA (uracil1939-C5)-methyltransferase
MPATYNQIQNWVHNHYGFTPATCYITHVKEICGLPLKKAWNRQAQMDRKKPCPPNKIIPIKNAFKHFGMV